MMKLFDTMEIETHYILRVPGGYIFTDRRADNAPSGVFVPLSNL